MRSLGREAIGSPAVTASTIAVLGQVGAAVLVAASAIGYTGPLRCGKRARGDHRHIRSGGHGGNRQSIDSPRYHPYAAESGDGYNSIFRERSRRSDGHGAVVGNAEIATRSDEGAHLQASTSFSTHGSVGVDASNRCPHRIIGNVEAGATGAG